MSLKCNNMDLEGLKLECGKRLGSEMEKNIIEVECHIGTRFEGDTLITHKPGFPSYEITIPGLKDSSKKDILQQIQNNGKITIRFE